MEHFRLQKWLIKLVVISCLGFQGRANAQERHDLIPDAVILQHAGSIGYLSVGGSYEIFNNRRGNLDVLYGFVPRNKGGTLHIITTKFGYRPFVLQVKDLLTVYPINPGLFLSYTIDEKLSFLFDTEQYGKSYYGWSEALRSHVSLSQEIQLHTGRLLRTKSLNRVTIYSEFNASDLYLVSWIQNPKTLSATDVFKLGVGIKVKF